MNQWAISGYPQKTRQWNEKYLDAISLDGGPSIAQLQSFPSRQFWRPLVLVERVGAILLISQDAGKLAEFYRSALGLPLEDEVHEGVPLHFGCDLGELHFAIHPAETWPGNPHEDAQSPVIVFTTADAGEVFDSLQKSGIAVTPPFDHGFAIIVAFRDPDGNNVQVMQLPSR